MFNHFFRNILTLKLIQLVPVISASTPSHFVTIDGYNIPSDIQRSDPELYQPNQLEAILGSSLFWNLIIDLDLLLLLVLKYYVISLNLFQKITS